MLLRVRPRLAIELSVNSSVYGPQIERITEDSSETALSVFTGALESIQNVIGWMEQGETVTITITRTGR